MESETPEGFFERLKERQPRDLVMGFNNVRAFAEYRYKAKDELPQGVFAPKELAK